MSAALAAEMQFLRAVVIFLLLTNAFSIGLAYAAIALGQGNKIRDGIARKFGARG